MKSAPEPNTWISHSVVVEDWKTRLDTLLDVADGYIVLPGGTGTLVGLSVAWEKRCKNLSKNLAEHKKPLAVYSPFWKATVQTVIAANQSTAEHIYMRDTAEALVAAVLPQEE